MLLSVKLGHTGFKIWHCEECRVVKDVMWVNTDSAQWGEYVSVDRVNYELIIATRQAKRIDVFLERKLILINPIADIEDESETIDEAIKRIKKIVASA